MVPGLVSMCVLPGELPEAEYQLSVAWARRLSLPPPPPPPPPAVDEAPAAAAAAVAAAAAKAGRGDGKGKGKGKGKAKGKRKKKGEAKAETGAGQAAASALLRLMTLSVALRRALLSGCASEARLEALLVAVLSRLTGRKREAEGRWGTTTALVYLQEEQRSRSDGAVEPVLEALFSRWASLFRGAEAPESQARTPAMRRLLESESRPDPDVRSRYMLGPEREQRGAAEGRRLVGVVDAMVMRGSPARSPSVGQR